MILKYEKISKDNIVMASRIQYKIFPNSSAYLKYLKEIQSDTSDLPISFLVFENDDQYDIKEGKCKIFGYSLCDKPIDYWNNKFIDIASDDKDHEKSIKLMKKDNII